MKQIKNVTLEMSLKPFKQTDDAYIKAVCERIFMQWHALVKYADIVSVMLWSSDGSEILEYKGELNEEFEWAKYIGGANPRTEWDIKNDPEGIGLHTKSYLYTDNPPVFTYGILKKIIEELKHSGESITGKPVRIGATFDPGPEFAKSDFKYNRHEEICLGETMGRKSFVCCYGVLDKDEYRYAGFPNGIPSGTPFGTFFGRQCRHFLADLGFDYLWLSNGFGFGCETWGTTGSVFDGERFDCSRVDDIKMKILGFWQLFRKECPDIRLETRGTNLSTGIDLASDGVPLKDIYNGGFNILPPPNSPWAAIDGDFGLELAGYMSRIAELPDDDYMFRFYVHDPWWMNSPWMDRYQGQPHDIYLPLAISRIDKDGSIHCPSHVAFLTINDSLGEMPDRCPNEIMPHVINALDNLPDSPSPFVWIYPFEEYHLMASEKNNRVEEVFFGDWFIRGAINNGLSLSTVVSTDNYICLRKSKPDLYSGSVLITPVPLEGSRFEKEITETIKSGGKVIIYGPVDRASKDILKMLNLEKAQYLEGILDLDLKINPDEFCVGAYPGKIHHRSLLSGGGLDTVLRNADDRETEVLANARMGNDERVISLYRAEMGWNGGAAIWIRGGNSNRYVKGSYLLVPDNPEEYFHIESLVRFAVSKFGYSMSFNRRNPAVKSPIVMVHRSKNAFFFSGYEPSTTTSMCMHFPMGAPVLMNGETILKDGASTYHMPRAWQRECRVFVEQKEGNILSCVEYPSVSHKMKRRYRVSGLKNAVLRIFPESGLEDATELFLNSRYPFAVGEPFKYTLKDSQWGKYIEVLNVTGSMMVSSPFKAFL